MFGPVSSQIAPPLPWPLGERSQSLATKGFAAWRLSACSTTGWRPATIVNAVVPSTTGRQ